MRRQKTHKGQPLMRNYVKYALTQLQLSLQKEKEGAQRTAPSSRTAKP
jgi:hypothetical protein